jgi:hypothetical protein
MRNPSQEHVHEWLIYDPETGVFTWRKKPRGGRRREVGGIAGTVNKLGYRLIGLGSYGQVFAGRVAWIYCHGSIPDGMEVDHRDCNTGNDRLANLRLATSQEQKRNRRVQTNNISGLKGAYYHACRKGKKWRSQIKADYGKLVFLGYFHTAQEAHEAYKAAAPKYFGEFARAA